MATTPRSDDEAVTAILDAIRRTETRHGMRTVVREPGRSWAPLAAVDDAAADPGDDAPIGCGYLGELPRSADVYDRTRDGL